MPQTTALSPCPSTRRPLLWTQKHQRILRMLAIKCVRSTAATLDLGLVDLQNAMTSPEERTSAEAEGCRIERSLMDCVAPPFYGRRRNPSVTSSILSVAKGGFRPALSHLRRPPVDHLGFGQVEVEDVVRCRCQPGVVQHRVPFDDEVGRQRLCRRVGRCCWVVFRMR